MSKSRPTIYDVAREAGVSKSLVSLVLRGGTNVSTESRHTVQQAMEKLHYQPSRAASDLAAKDTRLIVTLIDDYANPWFVDLLRGFDQVLTPAGYRISVLDSLTTRNAPRSTPGHPLGEIPPDTPTNPLPNALPNALSMRPTGIVIACDLPDLPPAGTTPPFVIAGTRITSAEPADTVANDDFRGARLATGHLLGLGHRSIAHLSVTGGAGERRREGYIQTMREHGQLPLATPYRGPATEHAGYLSALKLLQGNPQVTAIFAANDVMAIGALGAARELGLEVPGRLSVVGYDNTALAQTRLINLTTVDDDSVGVGLNAARLLLTKLDDETPGPVQHTLEPTLIERGTCAPPPH